MYRVAILGRPNVGKSTLFNKLTRSRRAIVGDEPGITRDRIHQVAEWDGKQFELIDTGGIILDDREEIPEQVFRQAEIAVAEADLVLLVVDGRLGVTPFDQELSAFLRSKGQPYYLVVNKIDADSLENHVYPFHSLGVEKVLPVSAEHSLGLDALLEELLQRIPETAPETPEGPEIRIAIIGRPNMGKSSLVNRFLGQERVIVTDIPGTTRDSVDILLLYGGRRFRLIDTAGIRRKGKTRAMADKLSVVMARKNLERCDVVFLMIEPTEGATRPDATIGGYAHDAGKSLIVVVNKWDLVEKDTHSASRLEREFRQKMRFLDYAPFVFVSAKTGQRVFKLLDFAVKAYESSRIRIPTAELNRFLQKRIQPMLEAQGSERRPPLLYASQVGVSPPTFVLFSRTRKKMHFSRERFLVNQLREEYGFYATPVRLIQKIRS